VHQLELNEVIGAKYTDGQYYRAKVVEKIDENNYELVFIDYGFEETVNTANMVSLSLQLKQVNLKHFFTDL